MIRFEDQELELSVINGESCIAVPLEVFVGEDGNVSVLTYSCCKELAEKYLELFRDNVFSSKAIEWVNEKFGCIMRDLGYEHYSHEGELMLEYIITDESQLKYQSDITPTIITSNEVLEKLCENTGCSIELEDDGEDLLFAVTDNEIILSYAGINDLHYEDGSVEISVETAPDRRREGFGIACVSALTRYLLSKNKTVRYKCSIFNKASSALAEKCGFSLEGKRYSYICGTVEDN